ncbi:uncharacterized protein KQ657_004196 [Scheffersomyces spartinae]|uniref:Uncharacterized protein n=1 Tax=Scheffersomyces spartinae TaxID=45513 RepID=A0A9P7VC50_9ASCO|nr:uncharacterized protein KQ657_004196 [Scheffersomyces spartinae]KAG7195080.1 hypothetical protein KQ657_004196 [Scheffersomyces spartinae]
MSGYSYPNATDLANLTKITADLFKETNIAKYLQLDKLSPPQKPQLIEMKPATSPTPGPIENLLNISQKLIGQYKMELPYSNSQSKIDHNNEPDKENDDVCCSSNKMTTTNINITPRKNTTHNSVSVSARGTKRSWPTDQQDDAQDHESEVLQNYSLVLNSRPVSSGTPLENKSSFFSPAGKVPGLQKKLSLVSLLQSTPVNKTYTPLNKMLKANMAVVVNTDKKPIQIYADKPQQHQLQLQAVKKEIRILSEDANKPEESTKDKNEYEDGDGDEDEDEDEDEEDKLACHANNIMRMAVDSTMLGSTFNASLSSHYDDSIVNILQQLLMLLPHDGFAFVPETEDADKSLIETMKLKWGKKGRYNLDSNRASRVEINEDDLKAAVGI